MPLRSVTKDLQSLTMTVIAEYPVPVERVWKAWTDPRQLERFWGPPTWPAKFTKHDFVVGGGANYFMTGPEGAKSYGWWRFLAIDPPRSFEIEDGFADETGKPATPGPGFRMRIVFEPIPGGARMTAVSRFPSLETLEQLLTMGMEEGLKQALGQLDGVLAS